MHKIPKKFVNTSFGVYAAIRYLSMAASFAITILMIREFSASEFVIFQTVLSCFVILYWIIDLGTIDLIVLSKLDNILVSKYSSGRTFRYLFVTLLATLVLYFTFSPLISIVMIAVSLDYFNDSMITYRTTRTSLWYLSLTLFIRKFVPLIYLILSNLYSLENVFLEFIVITIVSNLPWFLIDSIRLPFSFGNILYWDKKTRMNTLQQGGNFLQNLDVPLLNFLNLSSIIPPFVLAKRLLQAGSIFGQFQIPRIMDSDVKNVKSAHLRKKIGRNFMHTILLAILICFIFEILIQKFNYLNLTFSDRILTYGCLLISTLSIITLQQNALLKVFYKFESLCYSTFASTFSYLISIVIFLSDDGARWYFLIALLINFCVELLVQEHGLRGEV